MSFNLLHNDIKTMNTNYSDDSHVPFSIAIPTRHRMGAIRRFLENIGDDFSQSPHIDFLIVHDAPESTESVDFVREHELPINQIVIPHKSSMTELWNTCIKYSSNDYVLICNDDMIFKPGWHEFLQTSIKSAEELPLQVSLYTFGAFCLHKSIIPLIGWHDERFRSGEMEDTDWRYRIKEAGLQHRFIEDVDWTYVDHERDYGGHWPSGPNTTFYNKKWARNGRAASRKLPEINWHPLYMRRYEEAFGIKNNLEIINTKYLNGDDWIKV